MRRQKRIQGRLADTICFACRERGHAAKDCPSVKCQGMNGGADNQRKKLVGICYRYISLSCLSCSCLTNLQDVGQPDILSLSVRRQPTSQTLSLSLPASFVVARVTWRPCVHKTKKKAYIRMAAVVSSAAKKPIWRRTAIFGGKVRSVSTLLRS